MSTTNHLRKDSRGKLGGVFETGKCLLYTSIEVVEDRLCIFLLAK